MGDIPNLMLPHPGEYIISHMFFLTLAQMNLTTNNCVTEKGAVSYGDAPFQ